MQQNVKINSCCALKVNAAECSECFTTRNSQRGEKKVRPGCDQRPSSLLSQFPNCPSVVTRRHDNSANNPIEAQEEQLRVRTSCTANVRSDQW